MLFMKKKEEKQPVQRATSDTKKDREQKPAEKKAKGDKTIKEPATEPKTELKEEPLSPIKEKPLKQSEIREKLQQGWLKAFITFELAGKPRGHIEQTLRAYIINIKGDNHILSISEEYADAIEHEDGIFSAFVEMEALVQNFEALTWLAINFMPASIELLEPADVRLEGRVVTNWYNDLLAKLHEVSNAVREEHAANIHLTEAMNVLITNAILLSVKDGPKTSKEISAVTGILGEQLEPFFNHLVEKGRLVENEEKYSLP